LETTIGWTIKRDDLKRQRTSLFDHFEKNPRDIRLSVEIKAIDDEIARCTENLREAKHVKV
jgi:hypothetical protein